MMCYENSDEEKNENGMMGTNKNQRILKPMKDS